MNEEIVLTDEQNLFVTAAVNGDNIICNACWGSGKTTVLQETYKALKATKASILYLTFNSELKVEARTKFKSGAKNIHSYDSFAYKVFKDANLINQIHSSQGSYASKLIEPAYINLIPKYDILLIDEYQDANAIHAKIIEKLCDINPNMQIIVVGDWDQKIYTNSNINAVSFFNNLLKNSSRPLKRLELSISFRLSAIEAKMWGNVFDKKVVGTVGNKNVLFLTKSEAIKFCGSKLPKDLLIIGSNYGDAKDLQNCLEQFYPDTFNKYTVYSSITATDTELKRSNTCFSKDVALVLTYDKCKGLERDTCIVADYDHNYYRARASKYTPYLVLKNLFAVAATRAKNNLIFLIPDDATIYSLLDPETLKKPYDLNHNNSSDPVSVTEVFDYQPADVIKGCLDCLKLTQIQKPEAEIMILKNDGLIDLAPCIGKYIEPAFFKNYDIDNEIALHNKTNDFKVWTKASDPLSTKIRLLTSAETHQNRYKTCDLGIDEYFVDAVKARFSTVFSQDHEDIQVLIKSCIADKTVIGFADAIKDDIIYEFKFTNSLSDNHFLQCALYLYMKNMNKGIVWNIQTNEQYSVSITDRNKFEQAIVKLFDLPGDLTNYKSCSKRLSYLHEELIKD